MQQDDTNVLRKMAEASEVRLQDSSSESSSLSSEEEIEEIETAVSTVSLLKTVNWCRTISLHSCLHVLQGSLVLQSASCMHVSSQKATAHHFYLATVVALVKNDTIVQKLPRAQEAIKRLRSRKVEFSL